LVVKRAKANQVPKSAKVHRRGFMRLLRDRSGAAAMLAAIAMPILVGFAGLAVEIGLWHSQKRLLQSAADAGAMAAGEIRYMSGTDAQIKAAAVTDIARNLGGTGDTSALTVTVNGKVATVTVNYPPSSGSYSANSKATEVILSQPQNVLMMRVVHGITKSSENIAVRSVALLSSIGPCCLCSLEPANVGETNGGSSTLTVKGCGIAANSSSSTDSLDFNGSKAKIVSDYVHLAGGCSSCNNTNLSTSSFVQNGSRIGDPFRSMATPTTTGGTQADVSVKTNGSASLTQGTYGNISIQGGTASFASGVYVITGSFSYTGGTVTGSNVTFVLKSGATLSINGTANKGTISLSAPTTGSNAGMLFYGASAKSASLNGDASTMSLNGGIYFPKLSVKYNGNSSTAPACTYIVADSITFTGNTDAKVDCTGSPYNFTSTDMFPYLVE